MPRRHAALEIAEPVLSCGRGLRGPRRPSAIIGSSAAAPDGVQALKALKGLHLGEDRGEERLWRFRAKEP